MTNPTGYFGILSTAFAHSSGNPRGALSARTFVLSSHFPQMPDQWRAKGPRGGLPWFRYFTLHAAERRRCSTLVCFKLALEVQRQNHCFRINTAGRITDPIFDTSANAFSQSRCGQMGKGRVIGKKPGNQREGSQLSLFMELQIPSSNFWVFMEFPRIARLGGSRLREGILRCN